MDRYRIGLCQYALGSADSMEELGDAVWSLAERAGSADCYVFPELLCSDVRLRGEETPLSDLTLSPEERETYHELVSSLADAHEAVVVGGSYNVEEGEKVYNRLPLATPDELLTYDKCHPTPGEREDGKSPGSDAPPVVEHRGVRVGVANCYDVEFPEAVRRTVDAGVDVLAVPSFTASEAGYQRVRRCSAARAVENQVYVAQVPIVGSRGDVEGRGRSAVFAPCDDVCGPSGTRLTLPKDEEAAATCGVDVAALRRSREEAEVRPYTDARGVFGE